MYYKILFFDGADPLIDTEESIVANISDWVKDQSDEDTISIQKIKMSDKEFNELPEWEGP